MVFKVLILILIMLSSAFSISLQTMYQNASARAGYDKYIELDGSEAYTDGFISINEKVALIGNGAVIDLQNNGVIVVGDGIFDVDGCVFMNGTGAITISDAIRTTVSNCVFYNNDYGVQHSAKRGPLKVYNSIFVNNINAIITEEENLTYLEYNLAMNSSGGHFVAGCGS